MDLNDRKKKLEENAITKRITDEEFVSGDKLTGEVKVHKDDEGRIRLINDDHVCNHEDEDDHSHHKILKTMSNIDLDSKKDEYDSDDSIKDKD